MDTTEDFVVVDEENASPEKLAMDRLSVLVDLFSKSLDAVNQSNILLKDQLCSALSVTLQNIGSDCTSSIDTLINDLERNVTSNDEVRANYTRRLCSRLVSVNDEKQALLAELTSLKESVAENDNERTDQLAAASLEFQLLSDIVARFGNSENRPESSMPVKFETVEELTKALSDMRVRLSQLELEKAQKPTGDCNVDQPAPVAKVTSHASVGVLAADVFSSSVATQVEPVSQPADSAESKPERDVVMDRDASEPRRCPTPEPTIPREDPQPSFSAEQEEPWCPCCHGTFESRDALESHLANCLD